MMKVFFTLKTGKKYCFGEMHGKYLQCLKTAKSGHYRLQQVINIYGSSSIVL